MTTDFKKNQYQQKRLAEKLVIQTLKRPLVKNVYEYSRDYEREIDLPQDAFNEYDEGDNDAEDYDGDDVYLDPEERGPTKN